MDGNLARRRRGKRAGRIGLALPVLIFLGTGLPVYLLILQSAHPEAGTTCSASVALPANLTDSEGAKRAILDTSNLARAAEQAPLSEAGRRLIQAGHGLRVSLGASDGPARAQVTIAYEGSQSPTFACALVNTLAEQYAHAQRTVLADTAKKIHNEASKAANRARTELFEAQARFDAFVDRHFAELQAADAAGPSWEGNVPRDAQPGSVSTSENGSPPEAPSAPTADVAKVPHPERVRLERQLAALRQHREQLLVDRTPMHPQVRDADAEIADLERRLADLPDSLVASPSDLAGSLESMTGVPAAPADPVTDQPMPESSSFSSQEPESSPWPRRVAKPATGETDLVAAFTARRDAMDRARQEYERLADVERETYEAQFQLPSIQVHPAVRQPGAWTQPSSPRGLVVALAVGLAGAVGMGMFSAGAAGERTFATAAAVSESLNMPVLGAVPGAEPLTRRACPRRTPDALALLICGLVLVALCIGVLLSLTLGVQLA